MAYQERNSNSMPELLTRLETTWQRKLAHYYAEESSVYLYFIIRL